MTRSVTLTEEQRFWARVDPANDGCLLWTGAQFPTGYGQFSAKGGNRLAHRWAYENAIGPIPPGHEVDHLCKVRLCVNPEHLEAVTPRENNRRSESRSARQARQTHCIHGHPLTGENLSVYVYGGVRMRKCRACNRQNSQRRRLAKQWQ